MHSRRALVLPLSLGFLGAFAAACAKHEPPAESVVSGRPSLGKDDRAVASGPSGAEAADPASPPATDDTPAPAAAASPAPAKPEAKGRSPRAVATTAPYARAAPKPSPTGGRPMASAPPSDEAKDGFGLGLAGSGSGGGGRAAIAGAPTGNPWGSAQFQGVKAGEWDDNANYREFSRFLASSGEPFHRVDLSNRRFLVVRDRQGLGVPRCKVSVNDGKQGRTSFMTTASGRAILFPRAEGLTSDKLFAQADCGEGSAQATFDVGQSEDGMVELRLASDRAPIGKRTIDLAFVLDTTGSMAEEIAAVKATIQKVAKTLSTDQTQVRVGMVEYKDKGDAFVTHANPFTTDLAGFAARVGQIAASGGGDTPEHMNAGIHAAMTELGWSNESIARIAFVIADAPPHLDYQDGLDYAVDMKQASHRGIQLFTVAASGMDGLGQVVMRQMAQYTGATNMFVLRGGAGPQSTGGGDPQSSCGGTHTNYASGKLDELIVQKIRHELKALDADPTRIAGLRGDENVKPCDKRVVFAD